MKKVKVFTIATVGTVLLCSPTATGVLLAAGATSLICIWLLTLIELRAPHFFALNDPERHNPELLAAAAAALISNTLTHSQQIDLTIFNPGLNRLTIDFNRIGELIAADSHRSAVINSGHLWIADHAVPLHVEPRKTIKLRSTPAQGGRVRVTQSSIAKHDSTAFALLAAAALLLIADHSYAAAGLFSAAFTALLAPRLE